MTHRTKLLTDLSPSALVEAIQENEVAFWLYRIRVADWQLYEDDELTWYVSGRDEPMDNGVLRTRLTSERAGARINTMRAYFDERGLPFVWWGGPARSPADLSARLEAAGFASEGDDPGMAADLHALREDLEVPPGVTIERVATHADLADWVSALRVGNGGLPLGGPLESERIPLSAPESYAASDPYRLYLARHNGKPVATSAVQLGAGVAGLYCVATVPSARRQGIASAVVLAGLHEARAEGYRVGVLGSSRMGYGVYQRLGFQQYCILTSHTYEPSQGDLAL
ncbi:MAG TPA: GNAT family N-acetyltransferase [Ktedonobacterales bacterium]